MLIVSLTYILENFLWIEYSLFILPKVLQKSVSPKYYVFFKKKTLILKSALITAY